MASKRGGRDVRELTELFQKDCQREVVLETQMLFVLKERERKRGNVYKMGTGPVVHVYNPSTTVVKAK